MPHPLVMQLRFTRSEFSRGLAGITEDEARQRFPPMNSISWIVAHVVGQEQRNWLTRMQGRTPMPVLEGLAAYRAPATTPALNEMWAAWSIIIPEVDTYLDTLTTHALQQPMLYNVLPSSYSIGTVLQRQIYHYWYHLGEYMAIRQLLGHTELAEFVGDIHNHAPYQHES